MGEEEGDERGHLDRHLVGSRPSVTLVTSSGGKNPTLGRWNPGNPWNSSGLHKKIRQIYDPNGNYMRSASVVEMYSIPIGFQCLLKVTCVRKTEIHKLS